MSRRTLVPEAIGKLEKFKMEVADDMGFNNTYSKNSYMGDVPSSEVNRMKNSGNVGGEMVRRMVEAAEKNMINKI